MMLAVLSGIFTGITFVFPKACFLSLFSVVPLLYTIEKEEAGFKTGFLYGTFLSLLSMSFMFSMHPLDFMGFNKFISLITVTGVYLFICIYEGVLFGILTWLFKKYIKSIWVFPLLYAIWEFLLSLGIFGITFSNLYLPYHNNLLFIQSAGLFGRYIISLIILYVNLFIFKSFKNKKYLIYVVVILSINTTYGYIKIKTFDFKGPENKITLIQGNITSTEKWAYGNIYTILKTYKELTLESKEKDGAEVFIWPETVVPVPIDREHNIYADIKNFAKDNKIHIIWGAFVRENDLISNSVLVFDNNGNEYFKKYDKRHLIPFAEYNPFNNKKMLIGKEGTVTDTKVGRIGALVCIDSAYPSLIYETDKNNPDYFVVLSNDSWFKSSFGVYNHNALSVYTAIETGKYVLRCANTGITNIISPVGKTVKKILPERKGYITYEK